MKRVLALILCLAFCVLAIASCAPVEEHEHTYNETWSSDADGHWYAPNCGCEDAPRILELSHADKNNDGACDVCEYTEHTHTYAEEWTVDCTNHWNAADCGHTVAGTNVGAHVDEIYDGKCDVCGYVINDIHEHYYDSKWSSDETNHWHAPLCEHTSELKDVTPHELNDAGDCTVCGANIKPVDTTDILAVLKAAIANNYKVVTGDVVHGQLVYGGSESADTLVLSNAATDGVYFVLGNDESYVFIKDYNANGELIGGEQQWFERISDDNIFGVKMDVNSYTLDRVDGVPAKLNGYNYMPGDLLMAGYDDTSTLAQTLYDMYDIMMKGENVSNVASGYDAASGKYAFAYTYYTVHDVTNAGVLTNRELFYYDVAVTFEINDDLIINIADFYVKQYSYLDEGKVDNDLVYDEQTGVVSKGPNANPTYYVYEVYQTSGERTFTSPYPKASLIPVDFNFYHVTDHEFPEAYEWVINEEVLLADSLAVNSGDYVYFHLGDPIPTTSSFNFIDTSDFTFTFENVDPDSTARAWYMDAGSVDESVNGYSQYIGCLKLKMRDPGTYNMTVTLGDISKTFTLTILGEPEAEITGDADSISVKLVDLYGYDNEDQTYTFVADREGNYTFTIPAGLGVRVDGEDIPEVDFYNNGGSFTVGLNAGESVKLYFGAADSNTYNVSISYVYADIPDPTPDEGGDEGGDAPAGEVTVDGIVGTYNVGTVGTLTINDDGTIVYVKDGITYNYTYEIVSGEFKFLTYNTYPFNNGMAQHFGILTFDANGKPATFTHSAVTYDLTVAGGDEGDDEGGDAPAGEVTVEGIVGTYNVGTVGTLTINDDGTIVYVNGSVTTNYTYEIVGGEFKFLTMNTYPFNEGMAQHFGILTFDANGKPATFTHSEVTYDLTVGGGDVGGGDEDDDDTENVTLDATYYAYSEGQLILTVQFKNDGTVVFSYLHPMMSSSLTANYTISNGVVTLTDKETGDELPMMAAYVTLNNDGVPTAAGYNGWDYELVTDGNLGGDGDDEEDDNDDVVIKGSLSDDIENEIEVTADDKAAGKFYLYFMPYNNGEYEFASNYLFVSAVTLDGVAVEKNNMGKYVLESYVQYVLEISTNYISGAGTYTLTPEYTYPEGHQNNPLWITIGESTVAIYNNDFNTIWYQFYADTTGTLTITNLSQYDNVELLVTAVFGVENSSVAWDDSTWTEIFSNTVTLDVIKGRQYFIGINATRIEATAEIEFTTSITEGEITLDGTANLPNNLVVGDNEANITESPIYYYYTFTEAGTLTIITSSDTYSWYYAESLTGYVDAMTESTLVIEGYEGYTVYLSVYTTNDSMSDTIPFTASFKAAPTEVNYENEIITDGSAANEIVIENNTYVVLNLFGNGQFTISWDNADALVSSVSMWMGNTPIENGETIAGSMYGTTLMVYLPDYAAGTVNLTITPYVAPTQDLVVGDNTVSVTDTTMGNTVNFTATESGTYKITVGANAVVINNYENFFEGDVVTVTLAAGETITFNVATYDRTMSDVVINISVDTNTDTPDVPAEPDGSQNNPYVIETLPKEITYTGAHNKYYTYTATEDVTLLITKTGGFVSFNGCFYENVTNGYTVVLTAGQKITINPWATSTAAVDYVYTISVYVPTEAPDEGGDDVGGGDVGGDEGGDDVDGDSTGISGTYIGVGTNSRGMKVIIDTAADTLIIVRAASGTLDDFEGQTPVELVYSETLALANADGLIPGFITGTSVMNLTFDENGIVKSLSWTGATYSNFVKQ